MVSRSLSRRDVFLIFFGAMSLHLFSFIFPTLLRPTQSPNIVNTHLNRPLAVDTNPLPPPPEEALERTKTSAQHNAHIGKEPPSQARPVHIHDYGHKVQDEIVETTLISHAPGWTIFRNLYMADGTIYIVSSRPSSYFPDIRFMTSTGLSAENTDANIRLREPTDRNMAVISLEAAKLKWGSLKAGDTDRVWAVEGNTFLINDPPQFLRHYYHFVAELVFGAWAFWTGTFSQSADGVVTVESPAPTLDNIPAIDRFIFINSDADGWRDNPAFNRYFLRAAFPSLTVEHREDWDDRVLTTRPPPYPSYTQSNPDPNPDKTDEEVRRGSRVWRFEQAMFADRSAAFRGDACGSRTQRTAAEAFESMQKRLPLTWWDPLRRAVLRFAGAAENIKSDAPRTDLMSDADPQAHLPMPEKVVITYIDRQKTTRSLVPADHDLLVQSLEKLTEKRGWELIVVQAENLTKDTQIQIMARTTVLLGVHGNGLTHLVMMPNTRVSTVIEMFVPGGFAHDYQWTTHALGMRHFAVWNDTWHTLPNKPKVDYPEGFQGPNIPAYGPKVAELIEGRIDLKYP